MNPEYKKILESKIKRHSESGFDVEIESLNPAMFDFQKHCVVKALKAKRFALFEDCGLGKTIQQLEWCKRIIMRENKPVLILAPLAVTGQTIHEAKRFGYEIERLNAAPCNLSAKIYITNYDRLCDVDAGVFSGIALDESSILKNPDGKIRNKIIDKFRNVEYKSCWTATPSPNDPMELGSHAEFLGVMSRNEMLSMYFVHDGGNTSKWRIKGHAEDIFWKWVSTWAIMITKPSEIGFSDNGYILNGLKIIENMIETEKRNNGKLYNDVAVNATNFNGELRITMKERLDEASKIVNNSTESFIIWIKQDEEGKYLRKMIPGSVEVKGSDKLELKESRLLGFAKGDFRVLITKAKIAQYGLNYQNCNNQVFASLDFSFEMLYQAIRRSYRFGQKKDVNIYIITTDTMQNVPQIIRKKQDNFNRMQQKMVESMRSNYKIEKKQNMRMIEFQLPVFLKAI